MQIKYLQLNIWRGGELFDPLLEFIKSENPDIVALQEVYDGKDPKLPRQFRTIQVLKQELSNYHYDFAPALLDRRRIGAIEEGNAVLSRYPTKSSETIFYRENFREINKERDVEEDKIENIITYPRNLQMVKIDLGQAELNVFNTQGVWGFDPDDNKRRLEMSEKIVRQIQGKQKLILSGDFNVKENSQTIGNIERHLKNLFKGELETTFNTKFNTEMKNDPSFTPEVIDFVFVSNDIKVINHTSPDAKVSDHRPLVCELDI